MAAIPLSSLLIVGQRAGKYCRAAVGFDSSGPTRTGDSGFLPKLRHLMAVLKADYAHIASSSTQALRSSRRIGESLMTVLRADYDRIASSRQLAAAVFCFAFNVLLIVSAAVWCMSGYGFVAGLYIVVLAIAPVLMLLNIVLSAWIE